MNSAGLVLLFFSYFCFEFKIVSDDDMGEHITDYSQCWLDNCFAFIRKTHLLLFIYFVRYNKVAEKIKRGSFNNIKRVGKQYDLLTDENGFLKFFREAHVMLDISMTEMFATKYRHHLRQHCISTRWRNWLLASPTYSFFLPFQFRCSFPLRWLFKDCQWG